MKHLLPEYLVLILLLLSCNNNQSRSNDSEGVSNIVSEKGRYLTDCLDSSINDDNIGFNGVVNSYGEGYGNDSLCTASTVIKGTEQTIKDNESQGNPLSQKELKCLMESISSKWKALEKDNPLYQNIYKISLNERTITVGLLINTSYWQHQFSKELYESPYIEFVGSSSSIPVKTVVDSIVNIPGISLNADKTFYHTTSETATFTLSNETDREITFGTFYIVGYQGDDGIWYMLPNDGVWEDSLLGVDPHGSYSMTVDLHPQLNQLKAGTYRFYKQIAIQGKRAKVWIMTEFQLH